MSFSIIVAVAVVVTLALIGLGIWMPAYIVPGAVGMGALGLAPVIVKYVRERHSRAQATSSARTSYGVHSPPRMKAVIEAYNTDPIPDVPKLVDYMLQQAALHHASDVHLVPYRDFVLVRFRVDGILADVAQLAPQLRDVLTNRLKVMAQVVTFVRDRPQDGRIDLKVGESEVDLRVAFMPTLHGERIVMRVLDRQEHLLNINQTQIEEAQGFTFAHGLRTMLRQDPDVIMVGEIRDLDTSRIAIQAGMTGHLTISTVHAKSSAGVFVRLSEIGVDPHSVASAVTAVVAQRLVRVLCASCKRQTPSTPGQEVKLGAALSGHTFYAPVGCAACNQKGYLGRKGVFEVLPVDEVVRDLIGERASPDRIHEAVLKRGMTTLLENGMRRARAGETSLDEVLRVLPPEQRGA